MSMCVSTDGPVLAKWFLLQWHFDQIASTDSHISVKSVIKLDTLCNDSLYFCIFQQQNRAAWSVLFCPESEGSKGRKCPLCPFGKIVYYTIKLITY